MRVVCRDESVMVFRTRSLYTVPPKGKLTLVSRFSRESRIEDRVSILDSIDSKLDSILDPRFSREPSNWNFLDYADAMRASRKLYM